MKRELAFMVNRSCIETESHQAAQESNSDSYITDNCKRCKVSEVNGYLVYSRGRKVQNIEFNRKIGNDNSVNNSLDDLQLGAKNNGRNDSLDSETVTEENQSGDVVENISEEAGSLCNVGSSIFKIEPFLSKTRSTTLDECSFKDKLKLVDFVGSEGTSITDNYKKLRRLKQSTSKLEFKVEPVEVKVNGLESIDGEMISKVDVEMIAEGSSLAPPKNLELKTMKKIALNNVPMTVKELFETGLLEGVPVVYMGGKKFQAFCLRGIIKDVGILCSCSFCKGCRVIPPSQFEIHAINQYRRASQYICFENGKSLLDVLNACRNSPLNSLEETVNNAISGLPKEKTFTCKRCKGTYPTTCVGKVGPLCNSCVELKEFGCGSACDSSIKASLEPFLSAESSGSASVSILSRGKNRRKISRKSSKSDLKENLSITSPAHTTSRSKNRWMIIPKSPESLSFIKPSRSASARHSSKNRKQWKITGRSSKTATVSKSLKSASEGVSSQNSCQSETTTKDQMLHKLVFDDGGLPDGTEVAYYAHGQKLLMGYKRGSKILCCCCNSEVSPSTFEAHASWVTCKKSYTYIHTPNGVSLHEPPVLLSNDDKFSARGNDDVCTICADGGSLVLCDGCPRAYHQGCASLASIPSGKWFCQFCKNILQREMFVEHNASAVVAERMSGLDLVEQTSQRCIRIVKNIEAELTGCVLCRGCDFSRSGFGPRTIILCDQCEKEFHVGCLRSHKIANLKELPKGKWFCCPDCRRIHSALKKLLAREAEIIPDKLLEGIKRKIEEKGLETIGNIDVRWKLLTGRSASPENKLLLSQAVSIFQECFDPIVDTTGRDLIPPMVYGKNSKGQDYGGMYCSVLIVNSRVVSVAMIRIFGQDVAELPLVATSKCNHRKGYFQLLFSFIEKLLAFLEVQSIVLPSAEEAEFMWTDKFGFEKIKPDLLSKYRKSCCQIMTFKGTSLLQKGVQPCRNVDPNAGFIGVL